MFIFIFSFVYLTLSMAFPKHQILALFIFFSVYLLSFSLFSAFFPFAFLEFILLFFSLNFVCWMLNSLLLRCFSFFFPLCVSSVAPTLRNTLDRLLCARDFSGKQTGVGCHFLLHGIFPKHCRWILYWILYFIR